MLMALPPLGMAKAVVPGMMVKVTQAAGMLTVAENGLQKMVPVVPIMPTDPAV
jgi:hypothetical protein